jgi:major membrane immunogen (membrane-anchored lipoprotein)
MKKVIFLLSMTILCNGCAKDDTEISKFATGTYSGEKTTYYLGTHNKSVDTITIKFDSSTYSYSGSNALDFGRGNYLIKSNSIEFNDDEARNALYSWEWILVGVHKFRLNGDSLVLNQNGSYIQVSCRLIKIAK